MSDPDINEVRAALDYLGDGDFSPPEVRIFEALSRIERRMEAADKEAERLRKIACDLCGRGWPVRGGEHIPPHDMGDGWDLTCEALP